MTDLPATYRVEDGVAHLTLNRPHVANALTKQMCDLLATYLEAIATDEDVLVVVITGSGDRFCGGGDLQQIVQAADRTAYIRELADAAHRVARLMYSSEKPIVAGVHGTAAGGGLSMALLADILIAEELTTFHTAYSQIGITPDLGQSWLLPRIVGLGRALDLTLNGRSLSAVEARDWGMVSRIDLDARAAAQEVAARFAHGPAGALGGSRRLLRRSFEEGFSAHLDREADSIVSFVARDEAGDLIESVAARLRAT